MFRSENISDLWPIRSRLGAPLLWRQGCPFCDSTSRIVSLSLFWNNSNSRQSFRGPKRRFPEFVHAFHCRGLYFGYGLNERPRSNLQVGGTGFVDIDTTSCGAQKLLD